MRTHNVSARYLYEVTPEDAAAFFAAIQNTLARKTCRDAVKLLNKAFSTWLPVGAANPFAQLVGRRSPDGGETVHRKPFSADELKALLSAARSDEHLFPLIVTAACTGMRRGDVCRLRWPAVDLEHGMLNVKTGKTGATVEIPIFPPLRAVLEAAKGKREGYVFPWAARMLEENPDGLTWRFKKLVAQNDPQIIFMEGDCPEQPRAEMKSGLAAIRAKLPEGQRRDRVEDSFTRYMKGASIREIEKATGRGRSGISGDLHLVEEATGLAVFRGQSVFSAKRAIREVTQVKRANGQRAASVRDWHALRSTWVTLALTAGVPVEVVRRVTGHATVEIILAHYYRPDREQMRDTLKKFLPKVLTTVED